MADIPAAGTASLEGDLQRLAQYIPGGLFRCLTDPALTLLQVSDGFLSMLGYTREELARLYGDSFWRMIDPRDRERTHAEACRQLAAGDTKEIEYRVLRRKGEPLWVLDKGRLVRPAQGTASYYCILVDITRAREAQDELRLSLERCQIILDQTNDIIFEWDILRDSFSFSTNWEKKFGYAPMTEHISESPSAASYIHPDDVHRFQELLAEIRQGSGYGQVEVRLQKSDTLYVWHRVRLTAQFDDSGRPVKAVGVFVDIDSEKRRAQKLLEISQRDTLTRLYNKGTAEKRVAELLAREDCDVSSALMIIDVDNFKRINDTMGHLFGDAFLVEAAQGIAGLFRESDVVGRVGGDEFIVYLRDIPLRVLAENKADRITEAFTDIGRRMELPGGTSCSIGIALCPENGRSFQDLYRNADRALYLAKERGKGRYVVFDAADLPAARGRAPVTAVNERIDSDDGGMRISEQLVEYIFRALYQSVEVESAVSTILEIVGRRFDVSRVYIFENTEDDSYCCNTFEWCNQGVAPQIDNLRCVAYAGLGGNYLENFNENGIFYCRDITELGPEQVEILAPQGIKSMLQCAIRDNGRIRGYVGFDECRVSRFWNQEQVDALTFIAEILSIFLLKQRAQERAEQNARAMRTALDNQSSWIYVVRPGSYEMLFINRKTMQLAPGARIGMRCHEVFFGRETPCERCPARGLDSGATSCTMEIYNPRFRVWSSADAARISWKGEDAILLSCHDITALKGRDQ